MHLGGYQSKERIGSILRVQILILMSGRTILFFTYLGMTHWPIASGLEKDFQLRPSGSMPVEPGKKTDYSLGETNGNQMANFELTLGLEHFLKMIQVSTPTYSVHDCRPN